ncbi:UDP-glucose 6-dehydrogenase ywqF [Chlamydia abortus]|uniref:UDP-glucose dehydrogenase family protein n=1 Tax=Paenibacillus sp. SAFN-117 TaxID=3436860 RepID=UPI000A27DF08|nr:UDP-glucose 6-dehydrogenase ywqF [Chlamydia abortus]
MFKIAIAGTGYVGLVTGVCLAEVGYQVICVDIDENKINLLRAGRSPIYEPDVEKLMQKNYAAGKLDYTTDYKSAYKTVDAIFIGVGTPEKPDGSADLSYIAKVARQIAETVEKDCLVVVKSTVPVGTAEKIEQFIQDFLLHDVRIELASNPEFLSQGSAVQNTLNAERIIIGTESKWAEEMLREIYKPFQLPIVSVKRRSAEMIKYAANSFLALKISYINDIANLCECVGADIQDVAIGMSYDTRIGNRFLNAGIGFGGSCFPKDTKALEYFSRQHGYELRTIQAAIEVNKDQKRMLYQKARKRLITFSGLKVAVLGLTYKPGTDDIRESASVENIQLLLEEGAEIYAFDPTGAAKIGTIYPEGKIGKGCIKYVHDVEEAVKGADICFIFTEWDEIVSIIPSTFKRLMRTPLVYDGRNIYNVKEMEKAAVEYYSIGRTSGKPQITSQIQKQFSY